MNWFHSLTLVFVVGKIWGPLADWSWWLVFAPSIFTIGFGLFILIVSIAIATSSK